MFRYHHHLMVQICLHGTWHSNSWLSEKKIMSLRKNKRSFENWKLKQQAWILSNMRYSRKRVKIHELSRKSDLNYCKCIIGVIMVGRSWKRKQKKIVTIQRVGVTNLLQSYPVISLIASLSAWRAIFFTWGSRFTDHTQNLIMYPETHFDKNVKLVMIELRCYQNRYIMHKNGWDVTILSCANKYKRL